MPAQSVLGQVGCLPGRTIAFRREILVRVMPEFMTGRFLGVFLEVSDDRTLTNLTLKEGYRTVYQATSLCYTDAPLTWRKLYKQQLRWARGSQYNTMWMLAHAPVLAIFFLADIALPFLLLGALIGWAYRASTGTGIDFYDAFLAEYGLSAGITRILVLAAVASALSMGLRHLRHLAERPTDILWMPVFVLISSAFLMPIRLIGFFRCAHAGSWGTRADAYSAGEDLMAELEHPTAHAPQDIVDRTDAGGGGGMPAPRRRATATVLPDAKQTVVTTAARTRVRRPPNPLALVPYVIGTLIIATEVAFHG
jgi:hyaluronan synthase